MGTVEEEADESGLWLELPEDAELIPAARLAQLRTEADALIAIAVASVRTARKAANPQSPTRSPQSL